MPEPRPPAVHFSRRLGLGVVAGLQFLGAGLHIWCHRAAAGLPGVRGMAGPGRDFFVLCSSSIPVVVVLLGVLALWGSVDRSLSLRHLRVLSACIGGFWLVRLVLEFVLPVDLVLLGVPVSPLVRILIVAGLVILVWPEVRPAESSGGDRGSGAGAPKTGAGTTSRAAPPSERLWC